MSYTLYYAPGAASMAVHWMLIEVGAPFEAVLVDIDAGAQRDPGYLRLNPAGRVPTLIVEGVPRHESAALMMLLAERRQEAAMMPPVGSAGRADWLEMMVYLSDERFSHNDFNLLEAAMSKLSVVSQEQSQRISR